jgi:hypothetical protein
MLVRVREFGAAHRELFPAAGPGGQLFAAVSKAVDELSTYVATQATVRGASRGGAASKAAARQALNQALDAIARTARALDPTGLGGKFYLPSARNDHELATTARRFGEEAAPLKAPLVAHGLPKSFLTDLQATLDAFERATQDRLAALEANAAAGAGISAAIDTAMAALTRLDPVVANTLRDEPARLAAWAAARHTTRVRAGRARAGRDGVPAEAVTSVPGPSKAPDTGAAA